MATPIGVAWSSPCGDGVGVSLDCPCSTSGGCARQRAAADGLCTSSLHRLARLPCFALAGPPQQPLSAAAPLHARSSRSRTALALLIAMASALRLARPLLAGTRTRLAPRLVAPTPTAPLASTSYKPALRSFTSSRTLEWKRKTPSLKARPRQKTKTRKSAATRWAVLADGQFLRVRGRLIEAPGLPCLGPISAELGLRPSCRNWH